MVMSETYALLAEKAGGVVAAVPKETGGRKAVRSWSIKRTGKEMAEITVPPGTVIDGRDVSFFRFSVEARFVKSFENDPNYYHVLFPETDGDGRPWKVTLRRKDGHWEKTSPYKHGRGTWVVDNTETVSVTAKSLAGALKGRRGGNSQEASL